MFKTQSRKPIPGTTLNSTLCGAIEKKCRVLCRYIDGEKRILEPHCHGYSHAGKEVLSAYQVKGPSQIGWKLFEVGKLTEMEVMEEPFVARLDFNAESPGLTQIHCRLPA